MSELSNSLKYYLHSLSLCRTKSFSINSPSTYMYNIFYFKYIEIPSNTYTNKIVVSTEQRRRKSTCDFQSVSAFSCHFLSFHLIANRYSLRTHYNIIYCHFIQTPHLYGKKYRGVTNWNSSSCERNLELCVWGVTKF